MPGGTAEDLTTSLLMAATEVTAGSDVQPSSASISAMDCSIVANVNSPAIPGCTSAAGNVPVNALVLLLAGRLA